MKQRCVLNKCFSINDNLEVFARDLLYEMERELNSGETESVHRERHCICTKFRKVDVNKMNGNFKR